MDAEAEVRAAAIRRAEALGRGDRDELAALLHPLFVWTSHRGESFDRAGYLNANTSGGLQWLRQQLTDVDVRVVDDLAILRCTVIDDVTTAAGREAFRMPMTNVGPRSTRLAVCRRPRRAASHVGPLNETMPWAGRHSVLAGLSSVCLLVVVGRLLERGRLLGDPSFTFGYRLVEGP